jgi:hypothetical protein
MPAHLGRWLGTLAVDAGPAYGEFYAQCLHFNRMKGREHGNGFPRIAVLVLLCLISASQLVQGYESVDRLVIRGRIRAQLPELEASAKKAIFESPEVKGIWQQIFLQNQIATEYLKIIAQR